MFNRYALDISSHWLFPLIGWNAHCAFVVKEWPHSLVPILLANYRSLVLLEASARVNTLMLALESIPHVILLQIACFLKRYSVAVLVQIIQRVTQNLLVIVLLVFVNLRELAKAALFRSNVPFLYFFVFAVVRERTFRKKLLVCYLEHS